MLLYTYLYISLFHGLAFVIIDGWWFLPGGWWCLPGGWWCLPGGWWCILASSPAYSQPDTQAGERNAPQCGGALA